VPADLGVDSQGSEGRDHCRRFHTQNPRSPDPPGRNAGAERCGCEKSDIVFVIAPGTHRPMTPAEISAKLGAQIAEQYEVVNVPAWDDDQMVYMGMSSSGIPAWVNRRVVEADVRIGIGMITPHMDAGFSGGSKIILPGVCSEKTVDSFHMALAYIPENQLGNPMQCCASAWKSLYRRQPRWTS